jgi:rfaE bifunctional protein nucleotidyltransferase chain/domain
MGKSKIQTLVQLKNPVRQVKARGDQVVLTNGCFDVLHRGHLQLLYRAKELGDILIVAINTDASVRSLKGPDRPINTEMDRAELLAALEMVDYVTLFAKPDPYDIIVELLPDVLVKGGDWQIEDVVGGDVVKAHGGRVEIVPLVDRYSSTSLIGRIRQG